jgi:Helix-turn-helix.
MATVTRAERRPRTLLHDPAAVTRAREEAGLRKVDVANALEVSLSLISEIEGGTRNLTLPNLVRLARILGVHPKTLRAQRAPAR